MSKHRQSNGKAHGTLDAGVRARIQESHERAKFVLEASKLALDAQSQQLSRPTKPSRLDISNLFGHQSYTLPSEGGKVRVRKSLSPRPSFDPVHDDMQSTRKTIETEEDTRHLLNPTRTSSHGRSMTRNRCTLSPYEMSNRSGARAVAANMNGTTAQDLTVDDILAGSRSEKVRRLSQVPANSGRTSYNRTQSQNAAMARFEKDENNFIAEIPEGFQPGSPPTCQMPPNKQGKHTLMVDSAKIPIQLDDFGGEGYLLRK